MAIATEKTPTSKACRASSSYAKDSGEPGGSAARSAPGTSGPATPGPSHASASASSGSRAVSRKTSRVTSAAAAASSVPPMRSVLNETRNRSSARRRAPSASSRSRTGLGATGLAPARRSFHANPSGRSPERHLWTARSNPPSRKSPRGSSTSRSGGIPWAAFSTALKSALARRSRRKPNTSSGRIAGSTGTPAGGASTGTPCSYAAIFAEPRVGPMASPPLPLPARAGARGGLAAGPGSCALCEVPAGSPAAVSSSPRSYSFRIPCLRRSAISSSPMRSPAAKSKAPLS